MGYMGNMYLPAAEVTVECRGATHRDEWECDLITLTLGLGHNYNLSALARRTGGESIRRSTLP